MKKLIYIAAGIIIFSSTVFGVNTICAETALQQRPVVNTVTPAASVPVKQTVKPLDLVNAPQKYLNKTVVMNAVFDKFSTLGLDYKPAMRSSEEYIGILIKRDDVVDHTIPLSEMKMFLKRDLAEKNINLEADDKIQITGKVFSTALGDPWVDITEIIVIKKAEKKDNK